MSSLDDKRKKPDKSYGRKPYVIVNSENDTYNDMMTTIPRQAMMDQRLEKKSQFDKPYLKDGNYNDMEYGYAFRAPSFTNLKLNFPKVRPVPTDEEMPIPWAWPPCLLALDGPFYCTKSAGDADWVSQAELHIPMVRQGYFPGETLIECLGIASLNTTIFLNRKAYNNLDRSRSGEITIKEPPGGWNIGDRLEAVTTCRDQDGKIISGCSDRITIFCRNRDCCSGSAYIAPSIVAGSTDDTIDNATPATVTIKDGCPPYTWSVSGTGYSINPNGSSVLLSATVSVATGTCGTQYSAYCTVTVIDVCGNSVTKTIRHTAGAWHLYNESVGVSDTYVNCGQYPGDYYQEFTSGLKHWRIKHTYCMKNYAPDSRWSKVGWDSAWNPPCGLPNDCVILGVCTGSGCAYYADYLWYYDTWSCP